MSAPLKQTSWDIKQQSFYRLDRFYYESSILKSMTILGIMNCFVLAVLIILPLYQKLRKKFCADSCRCLLCANWVLDLIKRAFQIIFFLMIEETVLSIVVALNFTEIIDSTIVTIACIYGVTLIGFLIYSTKLKIKFFPNRFIQFQNIFKKIVYPILLIIHQPQQYFLLIFMFANIVLELIFDGLCDIYPLRSRMTIYKIL